MKQFLKQMKVKWDVFSLHYREYLVGFIAGFVIGAILF